VPVYRAQRIIGRVLSPIGSARNMNYSCLFVDIQIAKRRLEEILAPGPGVPDVDAILILSVVFSQRCASIPSLPPRTSNLEPGTWNLELRTPNPEIQTSTLPTRDFSNRIAKS
jgi:hypothetical protein